MRQGGGWFIHDTAPKQGSFHRTIIEGRAVMIQNGDGADQFG